MATHDEYVKALMSTAKDMLTKSIMSALVTRLPFLGIRFLNPLLGFLVAKLAEIVIYETEMAIFLGFTDLRVNAQGKDFSAAAVENARIQKNGTSEQKAAAETKLINSFREFVKLRN